MSMENTGPLLEVEKLEVVYNNVSVAVQGVSLEIQEGSIVALLGTNGAGKTTTMRAISGFLGLDYAKVTEGTVRFKGEEIQNRAPHLITNRGIVLVPERDKIFENLTVEENLLVSMVSSSKKSDKTSLDVFVYNYFPALKRLKDRLGGYLSGGERQMLSIAASLARKPELLLIDELSLGLAPIIVEELMNLVKVIRDEHNLAILLVEQNALAALDIADFGYVIENGRIVYAADSEKLKSHQDIQEFYMGRRENEDVKSYRDVKQYRRTRRWYG